MVVHFFDEFEVVPRGLPTGDLVLEFVVDERDRFAFPLDGDAVDQLIARLQELRGAKVQTATMEDLKNVVSQRPR